MEIHCSLRSFIFQLEKKKITESESNKFILLHVLKDWLMWHEWADGRLNLKVTVLSLQCWLVGALFKEFSFFFFDGPHISLLKIDVLCVRIDADYFFFRFSVDGFRFDLVKHFCFQTWFWILKFSILIFTIWEQCRSDSGDVQNTSNCVHFCVFGARFISLYSFINILLLFSL